MDVARTAIRITAGAVILIATLWLLGSLIVQVATPSTLSGHEDSISEFFAAHRQAGWDGLTGALSFAASTVPIVVALIVFILVTRIWLGRWREPMTLLVCVAGEVAIFLSVAALVERPRPDVPHLDPAPPTSSYPSGHTAAAVALYGCMAIVVLRQLHPRWMARVVAGLLIVVPVLVGFSRLYRGMHHPTDVVVGALGISTWVWIVVATLLVHPPSGRTDQHPVDVAQRSRPETLPHSGAS